MKVIETRMHELFQRLPLLLGFSIQDDLSIAGVEVHSWPGLAWGDDFYDELYDQISATLADVVNEREDLADLLRGRTLARTLQ
ncbi:MAG TPA: hypothetical protein VJT77_12700 [Burkholderiales bacterium]|nr:hypothetical protein [Burkholderiales bacterium]